MSISANVGVIGSSRREVQAWTSNAAWLPSQHRAATRSRDQVLVGVALLDADLAPASQPRRRGLRDVLLPEARAVGAVREALQVQRPLVEMGQHRRRDPGEVADELALRDRRRQGALRLRAVRLRVARLRLEQHLVEVRELQLEAADGPRAVLGHRVERRELLPRSRTKRIVLRSVDVRPDAPTRVACAAGSVATARIRHPAPRSIAPSTVATVARWRRAVRARRPSGACRPRRSP